MPLTNPARVTPPKNGTVTKVDLSTTATGTTGAVEGPSWYTFRADVTAYIEFGTTGLSLGAASTLWEIPAKQLESYYVAGDITRVKALGAAAGKLKYYKSGG